MNCSCGHPRAAHPGRTACVLNGCPCEGYVDPAAPEREELEGKTVAIVVPPGFALNVTLTPISEVES